MKQLTRILFALILVSFFACKDDDGDDIKVDDKNDTIWHEGTISASETWEANKKHYLRGNVYVAAPAELTIEPGTVIFGEKESKGALVINRGAKIHAKGTAQKPIVFTSDAAKGNRNYGDWGGVVILGKATNNKSANSNIEGITAATGDNGIYGGTANDDSSGEFYYVRIEFAGIALSTDNELNGLTFGSVGSGTEVHHIQVSYSGDDAIEWFGGSVNAKYLVSYRTWDDDFDTDFGYSGRVQFAAVFRDPSVADKSASNGFESDNNGSGGPEIPLTSAKFANLSVFGPKVFSNTTHASYGVGAHIRRNTAFSLYNSIIAGYNTGVHFDKTNSGAEFKNNWIINCATPTKQTIGNAAGDLTIADFATTWANKIGNTVKGTILSDTVSVNGSASSPLLPSGSPALSGAINVGTGFDNTTYVGAFDGSTNWMQGWTNFDPQNTDY